MSVTPPRLLIAALAFSAVPAAAVAERIPPLAPPPAFDPLTVPLPPVQPAPRPSQRVVPKPPRIIVPPVPQIPEPLIEIVPSQMPAPEPQEESGADLVGRGVGNIMENVLRELRPGFEQLSEGLDSATSQLRPALADLVRLIDDIRNYEAPERLPNGDVIIRRRADAPPPPPVGDALRNLTEPPAGEEGAPDDADRPALANPVPPAPSPITPDPTRPQIDL